MSTKHFCDFCGTEVHGDHSTTKGDTSLREIDGVRFNRQIAVTISLHFDEIERHICEGCVFRAVRQIDPGPRDAADA